MKYLKLAVIALLFWMLAGLYPFDEMWDRHAKQEEPHRGRYPAWRTK